MQALRSVDDIIRLESEIARHRMSGRIFMYRGQSDASWPIQTTLYRKYKFCWDNRDCWREYVDEFENKKWDIISKGILEYKPNLEHEDFYILSTLRHLGFPCHLIDWTACLRTAILFACSERNDVNGTLWILSTHRQFNHSPITDSPFNIEQPILICKEFDLIPLDKSLSNFPMGRIRRFRQNGFMSIIPHNDMSKKFESLLGDDYSLHKLSIPSASKERLFEYLNGEENFYDYIMAYESGSTNLLNI